MKNQIKLIFTILIFFIFTNISFSANEDDIYDKIDLFGEVLDSPTENFLVSLKPLTWDFLQQSTWDVVNHKEGTGKAAKVIGSEVHGKTGTAQNPHGEDHSWFAGYLVKDNIPILSLAVLVEHGGKGSVEAAIISHKIFKYAQKNISL